MENSIVLKRTDSNNSDFQKLVADLNKYLAITDGDDHSFYDQFNQLNDIKYVIVAYHQGVAVGCGAIKQFDAQTMEVKRMYTQPNNRGLGIASRILSELENWTAELKFKKCILETGIRQTAAVACYTKNGYTRIPNYAQYAGVEESLCFEKIVRIK